MSVMAGTNINADNLQAHEDIKKALKEAELQRTIAAMEKAIAEEEAQNKRGKR